MAAQAGKDMLLKIGDGADPVPVGSRLGDGRCLGHRVRVPLVGCAAVGRG